VTDVVLSAQDVWKAYVGVQALAGVNLEVRSGTVHCLVGENGSGKSTLTKIIAGVVIPDRGTISIGEEVLETLTPRRSLERGVRVIYQDLALFPNLTVAENLTFAGSAGLLKRVRWRADRARAMEALASVGVDLDPKAVVEDLSIAERQLLAVARAVSSQGRIILMDEPTAALTETEVNRLLALVRSLRDSGISFVFVTHKLREVMDVADELTILRNGRVVATGSATEFDPDRIGYLMTGMQVTRERRAGAEAPDASPVLAVRGLGLEGVFEDVDLDLHPHRVVGLAGLLGSGRTEVGLAIAGLLRPDHGHIEFQGRTVSDPRSLSSVQYVPEDRLAHGLFLDWSVAVNVVVNSVDDVVSDRGFIDSRRKHEVAGHWREELAIKAPDLRATVSTLSGGNQQRTLLARALAPRPEVVILSSPTVGVDVGSRADIHRLVRRMADDGAAVLLISDDIPELLDTCDEVLLVRDGAIAGRFLTSELDEDTLWGLVTAKGNGP
jgi:simple sugar transport system ATP-binding protein